MNSNKKLHQGNLLRDLISWSKKTQKEIHELTGFSSTWLRKLYEDKELSPKNIFLFSSALGVDKSYFEGKVTLPALKAIAESAKADNPMVNCRELQIKYQKQSEELIEYQRRVIDLQEQLFRLLKQQNILPQA